MQTPATVSQTTLDWYDQLGPWQAADSAYLLLTLIDSIGSQYDVTEQYIRADDTHLNWGKLLDVNTCPSKALPWLAQAVGVRIVPGTTDADARAAILAQTNEGRGTVTTIINAAKALLTGTKRVDLYERTPDPYSFKVVTYSGETASPSAVLAALTAAKPAGLILSYVVQSGLDWAEMVGTWAAQTDTWAQLSNEVPG